MNCHGTTEKLRSEKTLATSDFKTRTAAICIDLWEHVLAKRSFWQEQGRKTFQVQPAVFQPVQPFLFSKWWMPHFRWEKTLRAFELAETFKLPPMMDVVLGKTGTITMATAVWLSSNWIAASIVLQVVIDYNTNHLSCTCVKAGLASTQPAASDSS